MTAEPSAQSGSKRSARPSRSLSTPSLQFASALVQTAGTAVVHWKPASTLHALEQPSLLTVLPSSQFSVSGSTKPSPQEATTQVFRHASKLLVLPSSHASPAVTTPLPHAVRVQFESHPSPSTRLPSSHASCVLTM